MFADLSRASLVLVGPGRAGRAFARSWAGAGGSLVVVGRDLEAARRLAAEFPGAKASILDDDATLTGDVLALAVADDAIASLARRLASRVACRFAFHFSGALPADSLAPLTASGADVGSLHPLRAFTGSAEETWQDAFVAVEGDAAAAAGEEISRAIGARPRRVGAAGKALYHAAATLAAGGTASLLSLAVSLWTEAGLEEQEGRVALAALAEGAARAVGRLPFDQSLTGPIARRDLDTIRMHRDALAGRPEVSSLYALLARETLRRTPGRGKEEEIEPLLPEGAAGESGPSGPNA